MLLFEVTPRSQTEPGKLSGSPFGIFFLPILLSLTLLAGCGFTPAFGPESDARMLRNAVVFQEPADLNGFDLVTQLERRLGVASTSLYRLNYSLQVSRKTVGINAEQEINRYNINGTANYTLIDAESGETLTAGSVSSFTGYTSGATDATVSPPLTNASISTLAARRDANSRLMVILADQIVTTLVATAPDWAQ